MVEKIIKMDDHISKNDLDIILKVNQKAIEIQTNVAEQNETIIEKLENIEKQNDLLTKDAFQIKILLLSGLISLIIQLIQTFRK